jgi:hypothetical protein
MIPHLSWNLKAHYHVHKSLPKDSIWSQMKTRHFKNLTLMDTAYSGIANVKNSEYMVRE